jgi:peroxiredoxin
MGEAVTPDFILPDQAGQGWALSEHLDAAAVLVFYRGDW